MKFKFSKYSGAGNDFIVIDNRDNEIKLSKSDIIRLCNRNIGIGSDGIIFLSNCIKNDFEIIHYTSDGNLGSLCGNGSRCAISFAYKNNIIKKDTFFSAYDGTHKAYILNDELIKMEMKINSKIIENEYGIWVDTGSPHLVIESSNIEEINVKKEGAKVRYNSFYNKDGVNVNYVEKISNNTFKIRTYERGVENETKACGTGSTASAICMNYLNKTNCESIKMKCLGGDLMVEFEKIDKDFKNISITGPAKLIFNGEIEV